MTKEVLDHLLRDDVSNSYSGGGGWGARTSIKREKDTMTK